MDEPSLEQSCSLRGRYRYLVHLDLGKTANHFHNIVCIYSADSLENDPVGVLLNSDANACLVGQQVSDKPGERSVDQCSHVGVDDDEIIPLLNSKEVVVRDRESLFELLVCLRYCSF